MFTIRPAHLKAFKDELVHRFVLSILPDIKQRYAPTVNQMSSDALTRYLTHATLRAENYGLVDSNHITKFIAFTFETALDIDLEPGAIWLRKALNHPHLTPEEKLHALATLLVPHQFKKVTADRILGVELTQPAGVRLNYEVDPSPQDAITLNYSVTNERDTSIMLFYGYYDGQNFQSSFDFYWQTPAVLHITKRLWHSLGDCDVKHLIFPLFIKLDPEDTWQETTTFPSPLTLHLPGWIDKKVPLLTWEKDLRLSAYFEMSISVLLGPIDDLAVIGSLSDKEGKSKDQTILYGFNTPPRLSKHYVVETPTTPVIEVIRGRKIRLT